MMMKGSSPTKICIRTILLNFLTKLRTNNDFSRLIFKLDWSEYRDWPTIRSILYASAYH